MKTGGQQAQQSDRAFLSHFDRPIAFHRSFVTITGSVTAALMLSQLVYWTLRADEGDWIFKTRAQWFDEIGLSRKEQEHARKVLKDCGLIQEMLRKVPAKVHFRINLAELRRALSDGTKRAVQLVQKGPTGWPKRGQQDGTKGANKMAPLAPSTKGANSVAQKGPTNIRKTTHRLHKNPPNPLHAGGNGHAPPTDPTARDHTDAALAHVATELGITSQRTVRKLLEPLRLYKRQRDTTAYEAADAMIEAWRAYQAEAPLRGIAKPWSIATFFTQGHWMNQRSWPIDPKLRRQLH